jgi:hypothetical protein
MIGRQGGGGWRGGTAGQQALPTSQRAPCFEMWTPCSFPHASSIPMRQYSMCLPLAALQWLQEPQRAFRALGCSGGIGAWVSTHVSLVQIVAQALRLSSQFGMHQMMVCGSTVFSVAQLSEIPLSIRSDALRFLSPAA